MKFIYVHINKLDTIWPEHEYEIKTFMPNEKCVAFNLKIRINCAAKIIN